MQSGSRYHRAMIKRHESAGNVKGQRIAPPRISFGAVTVVLKYIALPILIGLTLLDVALYFFFQHVLERCYGVLCYLN
jgi:hypothetical protein